MNFLDPSLPERFWQKVSPIPFPTFGLSGCWVWIGATTGKGYGSFNLGGSPQKTGVSHKMTYEVARGPIVQDRDVRIVVDHLCRNRSCCNPDHLEAVPEPTNVARGLSPSALHAKKTHCPKGHSYSPENTYLLRGKRYCRACKK